jgi:hypothetical protein
MGALSMMAASTLHFQRIVRGTDLGLHADAVRWILSHLECGSGDKFFGGIAVASYRAEWQALRQSVLLGDALHRREDRQRQGLP